MASVPVLPRPVVASLNDPTNGSIDVFASDNTDLVIDANGYFAAPGTGGLSLYGVTPCRIVDTRNSGGQIPGGTSRDFNIQASACGVPATAQAYVLGAMVYPAGPLGYLTLWPQGQTRPVVATLNAIDGAYTSNMALVPTSNGWISAFASNTTDLSLDISGYFSAQTAPPPITITTKEYLRLGGRTIAIENH